MGNARIRVVDTGITCLHPGGESPRAEYACSSQVSHRNAPPLIGVSAVSLVFVHGLGGHPQSTWSTDPHEPKASAHRDIPIPKRVLNKFFRRSHGPARSKGAQSPDGGFAAEDQPRPSHDSTGSGDSSARVSSSSLGQKVFWPRDLLPHDVPDVRVLTFGYYSNPGGSSQDNLYTLSKSLLSQVADERVNTPNRPLIFVVHSLGGILTKFALKVSQDSTGIDARLKDVRYSTRGVIFFGTPHAGSDMANWGELLRRIAGTFAVTNSTLLAALNSRCNNGQLEELGSTFVKMLGPRHEGKFLAFNFRETRPLVNGPLGPAANLVVPLNSSMIVSEWVGDLTVDGNHLDICKFGGPDDRKYKSFVNKLQQHFLSEIEAEVQLESREGKEAELTPEKTAWLQILYKCPYAERKDINPRRVQGTCEWFTGHSHFRDWKRSTVASLLWVSADPGCGKSVLARYLVDEELRDPDEEPRGQHARTICYFFFKDGFTDQTFATTALCCILRQLFRRRPELFSDKILTKLEEDKKTDQGKKEPPTSFHDLWGLFVNAVAGSTGGEIVCVIDALDECAVSGRNQLIDAIIALYSKSSPHASAVKFLLTSRPYMDVHSRFEDLKCKVPTVHLSGESEEQVRDITREIDLVIRSRIDGMHRLGQKERVFLLEELTKVENRTYLWVHLVFDHIEQSSLLSRGKIRSMVNKLPQTVDESYERILSRSRDPELARKLLHIVLAAERPLTMQEMAVALAIGPAHKTSDDLELDLVPEDSFPQEVRELCGLFVVQVEARIYLLHHTAREFLVLSQSPGPFPEPRWRSTFHPGESHRILAEVCLWRLSLSDVCLDSFFEHQDQGKGEEYIAKRPFLNYATTLWPHHFGQCDWENVDGLFEMALSFFNPQLSTSATWFVLCRFLDKKDMLRDFIPLVVASHFRLGAVVQHLIQAGADVDEHDGGGFTPLILASIRGLDAVVRQLIAAGADVEQEDSDDYTPLHWASSGGHATVIRQLLDAGADIHRKDSDGWSPLNSASLFGHDTVVQQLLDAGASPDSGNRKGVTPLHSASRNGHDIIVQQLLVAQADPNTKSHRGETPLHEACSSGYDGIVKQLLDAGADAHAMDLDGSTPLHIARVKGHNTMVQQLLEAGADLKRHCVSREEYEGQRSDERGS